MNRIHQLISSLSIVIALAMSSSAIGGEPVTSSDLLKLLHRASDDVGSSFPEIPGQLTLSTAFTTIWKNASAYQSAARTALASNDASEREKLILAYGMQALCLKDLLAFDNEALNYWKRGVITAVVLDTLIFPGYDWNTELQQAYSDPAVKLLITQIKAADLYASKPRKASYLNEVLSGQASKEIDRLRRNGQLENRRPRQHCDK